MIKLQSLLDGRFRDRKNQIHIADVPMFSIFIGDGVSKKDMYNIKRGGNRIKAAFEKAREQIHAIGFPSMHANVLVKDLSVHTNQNTGGRGVAGLAQQNGKYMEISPEQFNTSNADYLVKIITHEWAHLWMFNNSKEFKQSVNNLYDRLTTVGAEKMQAKDVETQIGLSNEEQLDLIKRWEKGFYDLVTRNETFKNFAGQHGADANLFPTKVTNEEISNVTTSNLTNNFIKICTDYSYKPTNETVTEIKTLVQKYVVPKVIELANDEIKLAELMRSTNKIYDFLWVSNNLKPSGTSVVKIFNQLHVPAALSSMKRVMANSKAFSGRDYEFHRSYLRNLHNWASAY